MRTAIAAKLLVGRDMVARFNRLSAVETAPRFQFLFSFLRFSCACVHLKDELGRRPSAALLKKTKFRTEKEEGG
jgi:hypothetical protein